MNKNMMWGAAIIVALLIGGLIGFAYERQRATDNIDAAKLQMQKQVDVANKKVETLEKEKKMMQVTPSISPTPSGAMMKK